MNTGKMTTIAALGAVLAGCAGFSNEPKTDAEGFTVLFDGKTLDGWKPRGGFAKYCVEDGVIKGEGVPGTPGNTFLTTEKEYENFIFKAEFKCDSGNSGIQFRSSEKATSDPAHGRVYGYQYEITPDGGSTGRIYDEGRRGHRNGIVVDASVRPSRRGLTDRR